MKVVGAFFVVLGLVVLSGAVFSYFNDSVLFSPDERMNYVFLTDTNPVAYINYRSVEYSVELVSGSEGSARFKVTNFETGDIDEKTLSEGQTMSIGDLRIRLVHVEENEEFIWVDLYVTGKVIKNPSAYPENPENLPPTTCEPKLYNDGDAYIGEDADNLKWRWKLSNLYDVRSNSIPSPE